MNTYLETTQAAGCALEAQASRGEIGMHMIGGGEELLNVGVSVVTTGSSPPSIDDELCETTNTL